MWLLFNVCCLCGVWCDVVGVCCCDVVLCLFVVVMVCACVRPVLFLSMFACFVCDLPCGVV